MKRKKLKKHYVHIECKESTKQRSLPYHNLPKRTKLVNYRYVDDQYSISKNENRCFRYKRK